jgi:hypothetical protein
MFVRGEGLSRSSSHAGSTLSFPLAITFFIALPVTFAATFTVAVITTSVEVFFAPRACRTSRSAAGHR